MHRSFKFISILLVFTLFLGLASSASSPSSEVLYNTLNGSCPAEDISGSNRDGSCGGNVLTGQPGQFSSAYAFDGNDYLNYGDASNSPIVGAETVSFSAWIKPANLPADTSQRVYTIHSTNNADVIFGLFDGGCTDCDQEYLHGWVSVTDDSNNNAQIRGTNTASNVPFQEDNWYHIVGVWKGGYIDSLEFWVDGVNRTDEMAKQTGSSAPSSIGSFNEKEALGGQVDSNGFKIQGFNGNIDEFRLFDKPLNSSEIQSLYQNNTISSSSSSNSAPSLSNPHPSGGASDVSVSTDLTIDYSDSDGDQGDVTFYYGNGTQIYSETGVSSGTTVSTNNLSLNYSTTYNWYVEASDGSESVSAGNYTFTTESNTESGSDGLPDQASLFYDYNQFTSGDNTVLDQSLNSNDASVLGNAQSITGYKESGIELDSDDYLTSDSNNEIASTESEAVTVSTWAKFQPQGTGSLLAGRFNGEGYGLRAGHFAESSTYDSFAFFIRDGSESDRAISGQVDADGKWHHVVGVYDPSDTGSELKLYVDNQLKDTREKFADTWDVSGTSFSVGAWSDGSQQYSGDVDETMIFNRVLNESEISSLYNLDYNQVGAVISLSNPFPSDGSTDVSTELNLSIDYTHENSSTGNVTFYWENGTEIYTENNVASGSTVTTDTLSLNQGTTYNWHVEATDGSESVSAGNYSFTTFSTDNFIYSNGMSQPTHGVQNPHAEYIEKVNSTFAVFGGANLDPYIGEYDHDTGKWSGMYQAGDNTLTADDHGQPAILVDEDGYIHVFFGSHNDPAQYVRSCEPYSVNCFNSQPSPSPDDTTYFMTEEYNGTLYVVYRATVSKSNKPITLITSDDNGDTWSSPRRLVEFTTDNWMYPGRIEMDSNGNLHLVYHEDNRAEGYRQDVFYSYLNTSDNNMYGVNGANLGTTIDDSEARSDSNSVQVYHSGTNVTTNMRLVINDSTPHVFWNEDTDSVESYYYSNWNGNSWTEKQFITDANEKYTSGDFQIINGQITGWLSVGNAGTTGRGGDLEKWVLTSGSWSLRETVASNSNYKDLNHPNVVREGLPGFRVLFSENDAGDFTNNDLKVFGYGDSGFVQRDSSSDDVPPIVEKPSFNVSNPALNDSVSVESKVADSNSDLSSVELSVFYPNGSNVVDKASMTNDGSGVYSYDYNDLDVKGEWTFKVIGTDSQGNVGEKESILSVGSDTTPPTSSDDWTSSGFVDKSEVDVELTATDDDSGVANISYSVNGEAFNTVSGSSTLVNINEQGNNTLEYYATDNAGNVEATNTEYVALKDISGVEINSSVQINQSSNNAYINVTDNFTVANLSIYDSATNFGGINWSISGDTNQRIDVKLDYFNDNNTDDTFLANYSVANSVGNVITSEFVPRPVDSVYQVTRNGSFFKQVQSDTSSVMDFGYEVTSEAFTSFTVKRTDQFRPEYNSSTYVFDQGAGSEEMRFVLWTRGEDDIASSSGPGTRTELTNTSMRYDVGLPLSGTYKVTDVPGLSRNRDVDLSKSLGSVVENKSFSHDLSVQGRQQTLNISNGDVPAVNYTWVSSLSGNVSGEVGRSSSVSETVGDSGDFIDNTSYLFDVRQPEVVLGFNYTGVIPLELNNTASNKFTGVSTTGGFEDVNLCQTINNTEVDIAADSVENFSVGQNCDPGSIGSPSQTINNVSSTVERVYYNSSDMVINSNKTENTPIVIRAAKDNLKNPDERDGGSLEAIVEGTSSTNNDELNISDTGSFFRVTVGTQFQNSSLHTDDSEWSVTYTLSGENRTVVDGGGGGGGVPTVEDQLIYFGQEETSDGIEEFSVPFGRTAVVNMTITNERQSPTTVQIQRGQEEICQYIEVQETLDSRQFGSDGSYRMPAAQQTLGTVSSTESIGVRFDLPNRTVLDSQGVEEYSCSFDTSSSYGQAEPLVMDVSEGFDFAGFLSGEYCVTGDELTEQFVGLTVGEERCVTGPSVPVLAVLIGVVVLVWVERNG